MNKLIPVFLIIILGVICYANSFNNEFVWDDEQLIIDNEYIRSFHFIPQIFTSDIFKFSYEQSAFYRPIQTLSYLIDYSFWKLNPFGYHFTNLLLHICNAILIYMIINLISDNKKIPLVTSLLFIIHPAHVEAVTYISGRADLLVAFFSLLSLFSFYKSRVTLKNDYYIISILCFIIALLSKETALVFPAVLILFAYCFEEIKKEVKYLMPFMAIVIIYISLRFFVFGFLKNPILANSFDLHIRFLTFLKVIIRYFLVLLLPLNLHMERFVQPAKSILEPQVLLSLSLLALIFIFIFKLRKSSKLMFFSSLFFFINLLPVSGLFPINAFMAEHWLYLPSIGFFTMISITIAKISEIKNLIKQIALFLFIVILVFYSILTIKQNSYWKDNLTFCTYTLKHSPYSYKLHNNLGNVYKNLGLSDKAIEHIKKAIAVKPNYATAYNNLGLIYDKKRLFNEAIVQYEKAIKIKPNYATAYNNLGVAYDEKESYDKAINAYKKAIKIRPNYTEGYNNLGTAYKNKGLYDEAVKNYDKAIQLNPNYAEAYNNLGTVYDKKGQYHKAIKSYEKAIKINPNLAEAYNNLGVIYARSNRLQEAIEKWEKALKIKPDYESAKVNLERAKRMQK